MYGCVVIRSCLLLQYIYFQFAFAVCRLLLLSISIHVGVIIHNINKTAYNYNQFWYSILVLLVYCTTGTGNFGLVTNKYNQLLAATARLLAASAHDTTHNITTLQYRLLVVKLKDYNIKSQQKTVWQCRPNDSVQCTVSKVIKLVHQLGTGGRREKGNTTYYLSSFTCISIILRLSLIK